MLLRWSTAWLVTAWSCCVWASMLAIWGSFSVLFVVYWGVPWYQAPLVSILLAKKVPRVEIQHMQVGKRGVFGAWGVKVLCESCMLLKVTYVTYFDALITNWGLDRSETSYWRRYGTKRDFATEDVAPQPMVGDAQESYVWHHIGPMSHPNGLFEGNVSVLSCTALYCTRGAPCMRSTMANGRRCMGVVCMESGQSN